MISEGLIDSIANQSTVGCQTGNDQRVPINDHCVSGAIDRAFVGEVPAAALYVRFGKICDGNDFPRHGSSRRSDGEFAFDVYIGTGLILDRPRGQKTKCGDLGRFSFAIAVA